MGVLLKLGAATEGWSSAHSELQDALKETLRSRSAVVEAQRSKLALLQQVAKNKEFAVTKQKVQVARAQATVDSLQKKLGGIRESCDATITAMDKRNHAGHAEAHAVEMALQVMANSA